MASAPVSQYDAQPENQETDRFNYSIEVSFTANTLLRIILGLIFHFFRVPQPNSKKPEPL